MRNRFKNTLYTIEDIKYLDGRWQYVRNEDGTLFSGPYRTKIKPEDLPAWYPWPGGNLFVVQTVSYPQGG